VGLFQSTIAASFSDCFPPSGDGSTAKYHDELVFFRELGKLMTGNDGKRVMIARVWRGVAERSKADGFLDYMMKTGVKDYRVKEGNRGVYVLRREGKRRVEFLMVSLWDSVNAIRKFAGEDIDRASYYPEDEKFLVKLEPKVKHYEVLTGP
jgi:heme-degrading monooxygenase HmoA